MPCEFVGDETAEPYLSLLQCILKETFSKLLYATGIKRISRRKKIILVKDEQMYL